MFFPPSWPWSGPRHSLNNEQRIPRECYCGNFEYLAVTEYIVPGRKTCNERHWIGQHNSQAIQGRLRVSTPNEPRPSCRKTLRLEHEFCSTNFTMPTVLTDMNKKSPRSRASWRRDVFVEEWKSSHE
ncbi:hypothetical protein K438DRAFT_1835491 [Mycena galopus ATCC 62051]|nr:hypothetical protein K438DRAFT_1835491 [Mycena galopus ATCC 62051]